MREINLFIPKSFQQFQQDVYKQEPTFLELRRRMLLDAFF